MTKKINVAQEGKMYTHNDFHPFGEICACMGGPKAYQTPLEGLNMNLNSSFLITIFLISALLGFC